MPLQFPVPPPAHTWLHPQPVKRKPLPPAGPVAWQPSRRSSWLDRLAVALGLR